jgi:hypothetical protein
VSRVAENLPNDTLSKIDEFVCKIIGAVFLPILQSFLLFEKILQKMKKKYVVEERHFSLALHYYLRLSCSEPAPVVERVQAVR